MPVDPSEYQNDAAKGAQIQRLAAKIAEEMFKGDIPESIANALNDLNARMDAMEYDGQNIGDVVADSLDAQVLKVGGVDVRDGSTTTVTFSQASSKGTAANDFASGSTLATLIGKMRKWFADLGSAAWKAVVTSWSSTLSNDNIPSEKLVKNSIDLKADIASPTLTGTPAAPTASAGTNTTQIATTAFVHTEVENKVRGIGDIGNMSSDSTHAYTGEAVCEKIVESVTGNVGGYIGEKTVAQMNAYTQPKMGDSAIVTDAGTITVGSTSCVISTAPSEVRWTTEGYWGITSSGYVRDTKVATTSALGLVKTNSADGGVSLNGNNQMVVNGLGSAAFKNVPSSGDASSSQVVLGNDSRLAYDADVLIAAYTTQASGTTLEELRTAYHAGKKIYVKIGGSIGNDSYEELIPLSYVRNSVVNNESVIVGFYFESQIDPVINEGQAGTMTTYYRNSSGWSYKTGTVHYAEASGESNQANYAKGYVEGEGIAQALAGRMNTTANNAATEALDNLMTKLGNYSSSDAIDDLATIMAVSYNNGTNWKKLRPTTLWNYINSKASAAGYATRPRIALLDVPKYYQDGSTVEYVTIYDKNTSAPTRQGYQILGNRDNSSSNWGVCHVPTNVDYSKGYCEIEFDLQLWSYYWTGSAIEPYANLDLPYIINFVATTGSNDGASPSLISLNDSKIFATEALTIDCMRGTTASFAHVRLCGRLQSSTSANHAIYIGAQEANDWAALLVRAKMANVRIKYYDDVASMT